MMGFAQTNIKAKRMICLVCIYSTRKESLMENARNRKKESRCLVSIRKDSRRYNRQQLKQNSNRPNDWRRAKRWNGWRFDSTRVLRFVWGLCKVSLLCRPNKRSKKRKQNCTSSLWASTSSSYILGFRNKRYNSYLVLPDTLKRNKIYRPLRSVLRRFVTLCSSNQLKALCVLNAQSSSRCRGKRAFYLTIT